MFKIKLEDKGVRIVRTNVEDPCSALVQRQLTGEILPQIRNHIKYSVSRSIHQVERHIVTVAWDEVNGRHI